VKDAWLCIARLAILELACKVPFIAIGDCGLVDNVVVVLEVGSARTWVCVTEASDVDPIAAGVEVVGAVDGAVATLELC